MSDAMADWRDRLATPDAHLVEIEGDTVIPTDLCGGPWSPEAQHGSAVAATLAWAVEQVETPVPMRPVRFTVDLLSPVPLTPMRWEATTVKAGGRIAIVDSSLHSAGRVVARASTLLMRSGEFLEIPPGVNHPVEPALPPREALPEPDFTPGDGWTPPGFARAMDYRRTRGGIGTGAPASVWMRLRCRVVAGEDATPFQRLAVAADMGSQIGGYLPFAEFRTINADITVHIDRLPQSSWIGLDGEHRALPDAVGQTMASMFDDDGLVARLQSSLFIDRWPT